MANASILAAFERFWLHITAALGNKADIAHTHDAYVNQNAFSNIKVGSTTVAADTATDTVTFAGSNVTITPDATNDKITFKVADATADTKGVVQLVDSANNTATDKAATANAVNKAYTLAGTANNTANSAKTTAESKSTVTSSTTNGNIKIDGTETTVYTHPTTAGNKHIPTGGSNGQVLKWSASGTATWGTDANTTYTFGTGDNNGTIKVTPSGGSAQNIAVKGLGTAAYTASTAYAASSHNHAATEITSGTLAAARLPSSGVTAGSYGQSAAASPAHGKTFTVPYITVDAYGRVTAASNSTITLPAASSGSGSSGGVCEFNSGAITITSSNTSGYTNSSDSDSNWYWIWVIHTTDNRAFPFHVDWKALTTSQQWIEVNVGLSTNIKIAVKKDGNNRLVVYSGNNYTTIKRVCGYY